MRSLRIKPINNNIYSETRVRCNSCGRIKTAKNCKRCGGTEETVTCSSFYDY